MLFGCSGFESRNKRIRATATAAGCALPTILQEPSDLPSGNAVNDAEESVTHDRHGHSALKSGGGSACQAQCLQNRDEKIDQKYVFRASIVSFKENFNVTPFTL